MSERWRPIDGFGGKYEVSDLGNVRQNIWKRDESGKTHLSHRMIRIENKPSTKSKNRVEPRVNLPRHGKTQHYYLGRLVASHFVDGYAPGLTVDHINGDTTDNRAVNLQWLSRAENIRKGWRDGAYDCFKRKELDGQINLLGEDHG